MSVSPPPTLTPQARRVQASLELARELQGMLVHEFGNPLQSLAVLVELTHDSLEERGARGELGDCAREVGRLARALEATNRLRELVHRSSSLRALLDGRRAGTWGELLEQIVGLLEPRLERLRVEIVRETQAIDGLPVVGDAVDAVAPGSAGEACLALVMGAAEQARTQRLGRVRLSLEGRRDGGVAGLCVSIIGAEGPAILDDGLLARGGALLGQADLEGAGARCERDGPAIVLWGAVPSARET